jgi:hypothetical protein
VYTRRVTSLVLVCSLSSHRHSYTSYIYLSLYWFIINNMSHRDLTRSLLSFLLKSDPPPPSPCDTLPPLLIYLWSSSVSWLRNLVWKGKVWQDGTRERRNQEFFVISIQHENDEKILVRNLDWSQSWSQGSRSAKTLDPWDRPGTRKNPSNSF